MFQASLLGGDVPVQQLPKRQRRERSSNPVSEAPISPESEGHPLNSFISSSLTTSASDDAVTAAALLASDGSTEEAQASSSANTGKLDKAKVDAIDAAIYARAHRKVAAATLDGKDGVRSENYECEWTRVVRMNNSMLRSFVAHRQTHCVSPLTSIISSNPNSNRSGSHR